MLGYVLWVSNHFILLSMEYSRVVPSVAGICSYRVLPYVRTRTVRVLVVLPPRKAQGGRPDRVGAGPEDHRPEATSAGTETQSPQGQVI